MLPLLRSTAPVSYTHLDVYKRQSLLGAYKAQKELGIAAIGGKDSMSGTFEHIHVPPTLISFAVTTSDIKYIVSNEFKEAGRKVVLLKPKTDENGLPVTESLKEVYGEVSRLVAEGKVNSAYTLGFGGVAEAILKMAMGNMIGFRFESIIPDVYKRQPHSSSYNT